MTDRSYYDFLPQKFDFNNPYSRGKNEIPWIFIYIYLALSVIFCYLYHIKIVAPVDWNAPNSINAVTSFETAKPYQFRLLIPSLFSFLGPIYKFYGKYLYSAYNVTVVLSLLMVYYKLLCGYFINRKNLLWITPVILYPMLWNYIILNQSFQYYDFTAILLFTIGLYYIVRENFLALIITFIVGIINKETAGYLIFAYMLYNYKSIFTRKVIVNTAILGIIFVGWKLLLNYIFRNNPGDSFEVGYYENIRIVKELFGNKVLLKNLALNFGGLYIFVILLFVTGAWKKFPNKKLLFINLVIVPYYIFGIYITYITEVRVYTELIPMITTLFLIYLSGFQKLGLQPFGQIQKAKES
jgi:hypothetical protein